MEALLCMNDRDLTVDTQICRYRLMMAFLSMTDRDVENDAQHPGAGKSPATGMKNPSRDSVKAVILL